MNPEKLTLSVSHGPVQKFTKEILLTSGAKGTHSHIRPLPLAPPSPHTGGPVSIVGAEATNELQFSAAYPLCPSLERDTNSNASLYKMAQHSEILRRKAIVYQKMFKDSFTDLTWKGVLAAMLEGLAGLVMIMTNKHDDRQITMMVQRSQR